MDAPTRVTDTPKKKDVVVMTLGNLQLTHPADDVVYDAKGKIVALRAPYGSTGCQGVIGP